MTTTQFILIILAVMAIVWGLMIIVRALRKNSVVEHLPPSEVEVSDAQKEGLPIVPRHERVLPDTVIPESLPVAETALSLTTPASSQSVHDETSSSLAGQHSLTASEVTPSQFDTHRQRAIEADNVHTDSDARTTDTVYSIDKQHELDKVVSSTRIISPSLMTKSDEPDAFSALANATETLTPVVQTYDETQLNTANFIENSPILDTHIQAQIDQDQNSPLNNAEQNINISLFPNSQFDRISGSALLDLVDKYGLKYGAMNMFHRYENKEGTGLLWFSMMQVDDEGVSPFDLNKLPMQSLKGLVLFLSLPHPKAVQGYDSMMSIAGLLANDLNATLYDETGEPINRENTQYMREIAMDYGKNV